jgi:hypothetical protein
VTRFDAPVTAVAVAVDDATHAGAADPAANLDMRLVGARRATGSAGAPLPPVVLAQGVRTVLVFAVVPDLDEQTGGPAGPVLVVVEGTRDGQLAGVAGLVGSADELVETVSRAGLDAAVGAPLVGGPGTRTIRWRSAAAAERAAATRATAKRQPAKRQPAKRQPAKRATTRTRSR